MLRHALFAIVPLAFIAGCDMIDEDERENDPKFPLERHEILPVHGFIIPMSDDVQIATGITTGSKRALEQPIQFPHYTHASPDMLNISCEYCHSAARNSIHGGVPETQVCMNCHKYVKTDAPEIIKVTSYWESGEPIPWNKVHDLPDHVNFSHKRHVRAGVQCQECHGQVQLQGQMRPVEVVVEDEHHGEGDAHHEPKTETVMQVEAVMVREASLQMGWCIDCHANHPSVDKNYGDQADIRRAEMKDCWTCHK